MKFIENTTALCQTCGADKICKAHIVEKEGEEFLRTFCEKCGDSFIKIVTSDNKGLKKENAFISALRKKIYKNVSVLTLIGFLVFTGLIVIIQFLLFIYMFSAHEPITFIPAVLVFVVWIGGLIKICSCGSKKKDITAL